MSSTRIQTPGLPRALCVAVTLVVVLTTLVLAASSKAASLPGWARYHVEIQGTSTYHYAFTRDTRSGTVDATFDYSGAVDNVAFNGSDFDPSPYGTTTISNVDVHASQDDSKPNANPNHGSCVGDSGFVAGEGIYVHPGLTPLDGSVPVVVDPFQTVALHVSCDGLLSDVTDVPFSNVELGGEYSAAAPFDVSMSLPPKAMQMGKVIQVFDQHVEPAYCPGAGPGTTSCTLTMNGTVTFVRTAVSTDSPPSSPPSGPSKSPADGSDLLTPLVDDSDLLTPLKAKSASVSTDASSASVQVGCTGPCTFAVKAFAAAASGHASSARPLATAHGSLHAAGTRRVRLRFSAKARRAIRRAGGLRLVVSAKTPGGHAARSRTVRLRLRHH